MNTPAFFDAVARITLYDPLADFLGAADRGQIEYGYIDAVKLEAIYQVATRYARELNANIQFEKTLNRQESLEGADWKTRYKSKWGSMTAGDIFAAWVAHDNLHIRQFVELRRSRIEKVSKPYRIRYAGDW